MAWAAAGGGAALGVARPARRPVRCRHEPPWLELQADSDVVHICGAAAELQWHQSRLQWHQREGIEVWLTPSRGYRCYGLGERTGGLDKRGRRWSNWNSDKPAYGPEDDPLYLTHTLTMIVEDNGHCTAMFVDEPRRTTIDLRGADVRVCAQSPRLDVYLLAGPRPADILARYAALMGTAPMPPLWAFGYHHSRWGQASAEELVAMAREHRRRQLPLDALWLDIDHMDAFEVFSFDRAAFPEPAQTIATLAEHDIRTVVIVDPAVKAESGVQLYEAGLAEDVFVHRRGHVWHGRLWAGRTVWPDFTSERVRAWWGEQHRFYTDLGVAGFWNDMNEPVSHDSKGAPCDFPADVVHQSGSHDQVHNLYGSRMCEATQAALASQRPERRPFVLSRAGYADLHRYAFIWTGDNESNWEHLAQSIPMLCNLGLSGMPFCGADVGGFSGDADGELLARWLWLGVFYPFLRNHSAHDTCRQEPWRFGEQVLAASRQALRLRYRLLPYLYTLARLAATEGQPILRPLVYEWPEDPEVGALDSQLMLGDALLAAPVLAPGIRERQVYLPEGWWTDFWTGSLHRGPARVQVSAPLERCPLLQRGGSLVPMTEPRAHTGSAWWQPLIWRAGMEPETARGAVFEDAGDGWEAGRWRHARASRKSGELDGSADPGADQWLESFAADGSLVRLPLARLDG